jgi:D-alanyl-lipoteichoic acid acyltransferase DltB (MBOAT superfamily)
MIFSKTIFLYFFLPVFMGAYALVGAKKRPWLIAAANAVIIALCNLYGLIVFAAEFSLAYFSAIVIYNDRNKPEKSGRRKFLLAVNCVFAAAVFVCFAHSSQLSLKPLSAIALFGAAVIPLHTVSYVTDVYRGDCEAQTRIASLAAYIAFFPSAQFGPVLKYKNFYKTFEAPSISHEKAAEGICCYVCGLAEYVLIASQLENVWDSLSSTKFENLRGAPMWYSVILFCIMYSVRIMGLLNMGRGISLLMGFPVKRCFRSCIFKPGIAKSVRIANMYLLSWVKDYIYRPLRSQGKTFCGIGALFASAEVLTLWYGFGVEYAAAGFLLFLLLLAERTYSRRFGRVPCAVGSAVCTLLMIDLSAVVCLPRLIGKNSVFDALLTSPIGVQNSFLKYLAGISAPLMIVGLVVMNGIFPRAAKRTEFAWYRAALPMLELLLIIFCTAFMIAE